MKYLIENKLFYNSETGELIHIDIGVTEKHRLTKTANHILAVLIASHGEVVSRQSILESVWESRGHEASNSSLNQYISILRKTLSSLTGIDNVILTSPGVGFYLHANIKIKKCDQARDGISPTEGLRISRLRYLKRGGVLALVLSVFFLFVSKYEVAAIPVPLKEDDGLTHIGKCQIKSYVQIPQHMREKILNIMRLHHPGLDEHCQNNSGRVIIYVQRSIFHGKSGAIFSSFCPTDNRSNKVTYCNNVYANQWGGG